MHSQIVCRGGSIFAARKTEVPHRILPHRYFPVPSGHVPLSVLGCRPDTARRRPCAHPSTMAFPPLRYCLRHSRCRGHDPSGVRRFLLPFVYCMHCTYVCFGLRRVPKRTCGWQPPLPCPLSRDRRPCENNTRCYYRNVWNRRMCGFLPVVFHEDEVFLFSFFFLFFFLSFFFLVNWGCR